MSKVIPWPHPEDQLKIAARLSNPFTCFQHSLLSRSATELFVSSPVLFWLLVNHSSQHNWREKRFINTVLLKRTEILGIVCGCTNELPKSAVGFLSKFTGCRLKTDKAANTLIEWVRTGKYERLRHHKVLFFELLGLVEEFPFLIGAKWVDSIDLADVDVQQLPNLIRDMLKMADSLGVSSMIIKDLPNFPTVPDIRKRHNEILKEYLEKTEVLSTLVFPDPPLSGTQAIIPITDPIMLFHESIDQNHCVYSYLDRILAGQYFVYQVIGFVRATLGVTIEPNGAIVLDQLLAASNFRVSRQTFGIVDHWLNSITVEPQLFLDERIQESMDDCMTAYMEYINSQGWLPQRSPE